MRKLARRSIAAFLVLAAGAVAFAAVANSQWRKQAPDTLKGILWGRDGHGITILAVAHINGYPAERAKDLAFAAELPDLCTQYSATTVAWRSLTDWSWRQGIMASVHSLHGADTNGVRRRQAALQERGKTQVADDTATVDAGLTLHALGDAFAHVRSNGHAFGSLVGHLWAGHTPDHIHRHRGRYVAYLVALDSVLMTSRESEPGRARRQLDSLIIAVNTSPKPSSAVFAVARRYAWTEEELFDPRKCARFPRNDMQGRVIALHRALESARSP